MAYFFIDGKFWEVKDMLFVLPKNVKLFFMQKVAPVI